MIISIISQNSYIAELIQQYVHDDIEVCSYTSIALLQKEINLAQENIVIIDYESNISSENLEFVKNYSALVKIIILSNQTNNINSDKSSIIKKPFNIQTLYNLIDNIDLDLYKIYQQLLVLISTFFQLIQSNNKL